MSGRDWKPGDVAMVRNEYGVWNRAICSVKPIGIVWQYGVSDSLAAINAEARPLVVIDPEDREQVERLVKLLADSLNWGPHNLQRDTYCEPLQAALREFASPKPPKPPKPDEPMNPAATVIDTDGVVWVSWRQVGLVTHNKPWQALRFDQEEDDFRNWNEIDAVRVLSEGVQP